MNSLIREKFKVTKAAAILTTEEGGDSGTDPGGETGGDAGAGVADDLSTLFTPEDIQARKDAVAANTVEETRRAALTEEERTAEDQAKALEASKNNAPETYADFVAPEGVVLDPETTIEFAAVAKELNLPQEKAQQLVDLGARLIQKQVDGMFAAHETRKTEWLNAAKEDKEIGADVSLWNDADPESAGKSVALRAFNAISKTAPGIKQMVDELGIGNHPEFIRVFYRLGMGMREDTFVIPGSGGGNGDKSIAKTLWPGMQ